MRIPVLARFALALVAGLFTLCAQPAWANQIDNASATVLCNSYTISASGTQLFDTGVTFSVSYTITLTPSSGPPITITDSIPVTPDQNQNFSTMVTKPLGPFTSNFSLSGTASLLETDNTTGMVTVDNTIGIAFSPSNSLTCQSSPPPSLTVTKTADAATVTPGSIAGFTVTITNTSTVTDNDVTLTDPLPAGAGGDINWTIDSKTGNPSDFAITGATGSQVLTLNPSSFTLASGVSLSVHITGLTSANDATTSSNSALSGDAGGYTVLYEGTGGHNLQITNVSIGGNVGVGGTGHVQFNGPGTIGGRLDFSAANTGQYSNNNRSNVGPTSVNYNVGAVTAALNAIANLSMSLGELSGTSITFNNANQTVDEGSGTLQTTGGITYRVFNVTSYSENDGKVVTINGDGSGDAVVFNFAFNSNVNLGGDVVLTGGLTPDQVIWNFTSSNQNVQLNNNASSYPYPSFAYQGVILAPNDKLSVVNTSLIGRVLGGDSSDMQIVSGDNIHTPPGIGTLVNTATVSATDVSDQSATATVSIN